MDEEKKVNPLSTRLADCAQLCYFYWISLKTRFPEMRIEEFDYFLPKSLIAQYPSPARDDSRLMVLHRSSVKVEHRGFKEILDYLRPGDLLVVNDTRVLPARLLGKKASGGKCELLFVPSWNGSQGNWQVLIKGKVKAGTRVRFAPGLQGELVEIKEGRGRIRLSGSMEVRDLLERMGRIPLPPYIKREDEDLDRERYQTIFAERDGAVAAPTAGLHFTPLLLESIRKRGVKLASLTLHTGTGTFAPVKSEEVDDHIMGAEWVEISPATARAIAETKRMKGRVISVGTTTTRALESFAEPDGGVRAVSGFTSLFIRPPYSFRVVDGLVTNFHLPKSTLIMLVSAFAGREFVLNAYAEAVEAEYRFYSYGDAMLIL
jgi:S-adenosylmethionine:tRNA ribosyltransferase-isomerase